MSFEFLSLDCIIGDGKGRYYHTLLLWCLLPLALTSLVICTGYLRTRSGFSSTPSSTQSVTTSEKSPQRTGKLAMKIYKRHGWFSFFIFHLSLPCILNKQLEFFDCVTLESGESYVRSDTSISCTSSEYIKFKPLVIVFMILYQCVPLIWMTILFTNRKGLNPPTNSTDKNLALYIRDHNRDLYPLRFLFRDYACNTWWFEVAEMYRRILFVSVLGFISNSPSIKASLGCILAILSAVYIRDAKPYRLSETNTLAHVCQVTRAFSLSTHSLYMSHTHTLV
jgi:hypothetical protein